MAKVKIINNIVSNNQNSRTSIYSNSGISIGGGGSSTIANNSIDGYYSRFGILLLGNSVISNNKINLNQSIAGIQSINSGFVSIENNLINGNVDTGVTQQSTSSSGGNTSYSISNNKIFANCNTGISSNSSEPININGNNIKKINSIGIVFNGGNLQSNLISRDDDQSIESFVSRRAGSALNFPSLVVDNIFSHAYVDTSSQDNELVKNTPSNWTVERNLPTYTNNATNIPAYSTTNVTAVAAIPEEMQPIVEDIYHKLWYYCNDNEPSLKSKIFRENSNLTVYGNDYKLGSNVFNNLGPTDPTSFGRIRFNYNLDKSLMYNDSINDNSSYAESGEIVVADCGFQDTGITIEAIFKVGRDHSTSTPIIQILNVASGNDPYRRVTLGVTGSSLGSDGKKTDVGSSGVYWRSDGRIDGNEHIRICNNTTPFDNTHLMFTIARDRFAAYVTLYVNGVINFEGSVGGLGSFFENEYNRFDVMKILLAKGNYSTNKFQGGIANVRISNIIRDKKYAVRAANEAKKLPSDPFNPYPPSA